MSTEAEIRFKTKKFNLIVGVIFLGIGFAIELGLLINALTKRTYNDTMSWIMGTIIIVVFFALAGGGAVYMYCSNSKRIRKGLQTYGEEKLIQNIETHSVSSYKHPRSGRLVYFTNKLIIDPSETIIDYNEISLIYKRVVSTNGVRRVYIHFVLYDGSQWSLCEGIEDAMIHNFMQLCFQHNPNIMFGYTKENLAMQKQRVKDFKSGNFTIPALEL